MIQTKTTARIQPWNLNLRNKVGDSVTHNGFTWVNISGRNSEPVTPSSDWEPTYNSLVSLENLEVNNLMIGAAQNIAGSILTVVKNSTSNDTDVSIFNDVIRANTSDNISSGFYGQVNRITSNSNFNDNLIFALENIARKNGTGNITSLYGSRDKVELLGAGNVDFAISSLSDVNILGTENIYAQYIRGQDIETKLNNENASIDYLQGSHISLEILKGTVQQNANVLVLDFDTDNLGGGLIKGDFSYLNIRNDVMVPINGNAYAIRSESILPSLFSGKISATSFKGDGLELTNLNAIKLNQLSSKSISFGESYIQNYRNRLLDDGYTYFPNSLGNTYALLKELNIQNKASIVIGASGVKTSLLPAVKGLPLNVTRASTATYIDENGILQTALANVPRVTYDENGDESILVEPQSTNLFLYSEQFDNVYWVKQGTSSVSGNTTVAPDGSLTAYTLSGATGTGISGNVLRKNVSGTVDSTLSIYIKSLGSTSFTIYIRDGLSGAIQSQSITPNGTWQRVTLTSNPNNGQVFFGNTDGDVAIWGAQLEAGAYPTSYIPTVASTVTRNADIVSKIGISDLINSSEGVFYMELSPLSYLQTNQRWITLNSGSNANRIAILYNTINQLSVSIRANSLTVYDFSFNISNNDFIKIAVKYKSNDFATFINGVKVHTNLVNTLTFSSALNKLSFDSADGLSVFQGKVKNLQVYKTALTDQECINLTTL
jgi:hypothetical protein